MVSITAGKTINFLDMNNLKGIIIDTFGSLREEETEKNEDIYESCFICGNDKYTSSCL